jgi:GMP synthase-like glutamine amidotransferase
MSLHLAVLTHEPETGLGAFAAQLDEAGVSYDVLRTTAGILPDDGGFDGAIALGGSIGVYDRPLLAAHDWVRDAVLAGLPFLGICLGGQLLASALGARVTRESPEVGVHDIYLTDAAKRDPLFGGLPIRLPVLGWHEDAFGLPRGAVPLAGSIRCTYQAFRFGAAAYGLQFHPEVRDENLVRWRKVDGYRGLAARTGTDWNDLALALRGATPALDTLAEQLLRRWLYLVAGVAALTSSQSAAA